MRRRAKRDLMLLLGIVVALVAVVLLNSTGQRLKLAKKMVAWRLEEEGKMKQRFELIDWKWVLATKGSARSGAEFSPDLEIYDGKPVNIMGFMVPTDRFRDMKEFVLLPMPLECYFCERPPLKDKVLINMAEGHTEDVLEGPILFNGILKLQRGAGVKTFYVVDEAQTIIDPDDPPEMRIMDPAHMAGAAKHTQNNLQEGIAPPSGDNLDLKSIEEVLQQQQP